MATHDPADFEHVFGGVLDEVTALLAALGLPHMLIGGLAVAVRVSPRATKDAYFGLLADAPGARRLVDEMAALGFTARSQGAPGPGQVLRFHRPGPDGIERWVDVLIAGTPFEERAIGRATTEPWLGRSIAVATVEDLIIFKLLAGRPQDYADVARLIAESPAPLDDAYLDACAAEWGLEESLSRAHAHQQP